MPYNIRFSALRLDTNKYKITRELQAETDAYMREFCWDLIESIREYPPERPNQAYIRTFELFRGWDVEIHKFLDRVEARIVNYATDGKTGQRYMAKVQGVLQTEMHEETGWQRVDLAASDMRREYRQGLQLLYARFLRRRGIGG